MGESTSLNILISQVGLGKLTEREKQEYIDFVNSALSKENSGQVSPITSDQIHKNAFPSAEQTVAIIELLHYSYQGAKTIKKLPYFYDKAMTFLKSRGKDTSHMDQVKKMNDFVTGETANTSNNQSDSTDHTS